MPPVLAALPVVAGAVAAELGASALVSSLVMAGTSVGASLLAPKPKAPRNSPENLDRLRASIDPRTARKTAVGITALATDIRDEEFTDSQTYFHRFIVVASHAVEAIDEIWFDDKKAWDSGGGVQGPFIGYLTVATVLEGSAANAINISARMGTARRYTGCAYVHLRYKLTGNITRTDSPFAQSVPSRITIRGKGASFYDPRLDSTVPGGSGSHRADDQTTWTWDDDACRNPALALLHYLLGWKIDGKHAVGRGVPPSRIDLESFAVAANICDETITIDGGPASEPRYRCDGVWSEGDSPTTVIDMLKACMNADLDDIDGKFRLTVFRDDIAAPVTDFTDDDVLGQFDWQPALPLSERYNVVRGVYTDPSNASLYQPVDYPEVSETSPDGIDRVDTFNLPMVESPTQARRLAQLRLNRQAFGGRFICELQATGWRVQKNSQVRLTFAPRGWTNKLFRVAEIDFLPDGRVPVVLIEEDPDLYVVPPPANVLVPIDSTVHDPSLDPIIDAIDSINIAQIRNAAIRNARDASDVARELLIASDAGSTATISVAKHDWDYPGATADVTRALGTITGLAFDTVYYVYFDDATLANAAPTYVATTDPTQAQNSTDHPERHPVGVIRTPKDGEPAKETSLGPNYGYDDLIDNVVNFDNRLERNATTPPVATIASDGSAVEHNANLLGVDMRFAWTLSAANEALIHGFEVMLYQSTSSGAYVPGATPLLEQRTLVGPKTRGLVAFAGNASAWFTWAIRTFRNVDTDIDATGRIYSAWVKPSLSSENPYRPSTSVELGDSVRIGVGGNTASNVSAWAGYASNGLNSDGSVKDDKVGSAALIDYSLLEAGWAVQTATVGMTNETYDLIFGAVQTTSGPRLVLRAHFIFRFATADPAQDTTWSFDVKGLIKQTVGAMITYVTSTAITRSDTWLWPSRTGTFYTGKQLATLEWVIDGQTPSTYQPGLRFIVPAGTTVEIVGAHYVLLQDKKVVE